jgi:hypothetical protein
MQRQSKDAGIRPDFSGRAKAAGNSDLLDFAARAVR